MATKARASGKQQRPEGGPKARPRANGLRYRVSPSGELPADLFDKVSWAHAQAISHLATNPTHQTEQS